MPAKNNKSTKVVTKKHLARLEREKIQNRNIIIISIVILVFVVGIIGYGILDEFVLQGLKPVAKVGSDVITSKEFQVMVRYDRVNLISQYNQYAQLEAYFSGSSSFQSYLTQIQNELTDTYTMGSSVIDNMVDDELIRQAAKEMNITVSDTEIDQEIQDSFGYTPNGTATPTTTATSILTATVNPTLLFWTSPTPTETQTLVPTALTASLTPTLADTATATPKASQTNTATATPYTLQGFQTQVSSYLGNFKTYGFTNTEMRQLVESQLLRQKVENAVTKNLQPVQEEVLARHILVASEDTAQTVETRLSNGEDFGAIAAELSTDSGSSASGGDLGWFGKGTMDPTFETAAYSLQVGQVSSPVLTKYGYHIIQVLGHQLRQLNSSDFATYKSNYFSAWLSNYRYAHQSEITKYDLWTNIVPTDPTFSATSSSSSY